MATQAPATSPTVRAASDRSRCLVGEAVTVTVRIEPSRDGLELVPPRLAEADGDLAPTSDPDRFAITPRRGGTLVVPPFRAKRGDAVVASSGPLRLTVAPVPSEGRPAWFLGGVGSFAVAATVAADRVRVGESLVYQVEVTGPAAPGTSRPPDLSGWANRLPGWRVGPPEGESVASANPTRRFRYRLRPTRPGQFVLPPVAVAAFDPAVRRYVTRTTAGIPIEVEPSAPLEPDAVVGVGNQNLSGPVRARWRPLRVYLPVAGAAALVIATGAFILRRRRVRREDPREFARDLAARLDPTGDRDQIGRTISQGFAEYLRRTVDRPPGELTPRELGDAFRADDPELAEQAEALLEATDRVRFGPVGEDDARSLVEQARRVLTRLANSPKKGASRRAVRAGTTDQPRE